MAKPKTDVRTRFWSKVNVDGPKVLQDNCWIWTGAKTHNGYGRIYTERTDKPNHELAHRISYKIHVDPSLSNEAIIGHKCDTRACVNPGHLFETTRAGNNLDMAKKERHNNQSGKRTTADQIRTIRQLKAGGMRSSDIAVTVGVSRQVVSNVLHGWTGLWVD